eukprot:TRINITY_DN111844_c0_g1_i1.p1 TRINITY_DN111844_c0_g1~~TRINITY_DN111844_c0_g1_i1.p1  ORF type:complete len:498 (+),score=80.46 TRINITY_DN111844_c0_g1_i1:46-1539(+)
MAPVGRAQQPMDSVAMEILRCEAPPALEPLVRQSGGLSSVRKDILEMLKKAGTSGCKVLLAEPEALVALAEQALDLEELEQGMLSKWPNRKERQDAYQTLLSSGIWSPQALLRTLLERSDSSKCRLNQLLEQGSCRCLKSESVVSLAEELEVQARHCMQIAVEGARPVLLTAPHNIYLCRDGHSPHLMEEFTTLIAQHLARQLAGTCICWSRAEQRRSELLWSLARIKSGSGDDCVDDPSAFLDPSNRDPNFLLTDEVMRNPWPQQMVRVVDTWRLGRDGTIRPSLHLDIHGCRDPPMTPSHLTVGLAAMRHEASSGRSLLSVSSVEAFASHLLTELTAVLSQLNLKPAAELVRVLMPALSGGRDTVERLSGAWPLEDKRFTLSQTAVSFAGFTHSCQLELSKSLRRILSHDDTAIARFGRAITKAWALCCNGAGLPGLSRTPSSGDVNLLAEATPKATSPVSSGRPTSADRRERRRTGSYPQRCRLPRLQSQKLLA